MEGVRGGDGEATPAEPVLAPGARISDDELEMLLSPDKDLLCSITGELFEDPVVTEDGHTYERTAIEEWFHSQKMAGRPVTSPLTNVKLKHARVVPNNQVKKAVASWCEGLAKSARELADAYPGSAVELLERALEYHPDNAETWLRLGQAHEAQGTEGWGDAAFRCRFNHAQAKDAAEDYTAFLGWCEANGKLAEFEVAVLRIALPKCPDLPDLLEQAVDRTGGETLDFEDAPRRAMSDEDYDPTYKKAYQPRNEMPDQCIYACRLRRIPPSIGYSVKRDQSALLCVSAEGVTVVDAVAKLQSPIICQYTFHQILSWTVAKDMFSFNVMLRVDGTNQKEPYEFGTNQGKEISLKLKEHVNVLLLERSRERRARTRPQVDPTAGAGGSDQSFLSGMIVDEFYGAEAESAPRGHDDSGGAAAPALAVTTPSSPPPLEPSSPPAAVRPPAAAQPPAAQPSPTADVAQAQELAKLFPNESSAELRSALRAADGDFESAASMLLEKPLHKARSFRPSPSWGPGLAGAVRSPGSSSADVMEGAMAIMSAAMVPLEAAPLRVPGAGPTPCDTRQRQIDEYAAAQAASLSAGTTETGLASEPSSPPSLMEQLEALPVPQQQQPKPAGARVRAAARTAPLSAE